MTDETKKRLPDIIERKERILDIIAELCVQYKKIEGLVAEAMQDYGDASEVDDNTTKTIAFDEMTSYTRAYGEVRKAVKILNVAWEGRE